MIDEPGVGAVSELGPTRPMPNPNTDAHTDPGLNLLITLRALPRVRGQGQLRAVGVRIGGDRRGALE